MKYIFHAYGHPNIRGTHRATFEFTKDANVSLRGDCIIGINADFDAEEIRKFITNSAGKNVKITVEASCERKKISDTVHALLNRDFCDNVEFVVRKTDFASKRTFAIKADKAAFELKKDIMAYLREKNSKITVILEISGV